MLSVASILCALAAIAWSESTFTSLFRFNGTNGLNPNGSLVQGFNGNLYGATQFGGAQKHGTVFEITSGGKLSTLYNFCSETAGGSCLDGDEPQAGLVQATNGNLYGTTPDGGANLYYGTVFEITPTGKLTTLYSFCSQAGCTDGADPSAGLVQAADGDFYGTTFEGGTHHACGISGESCGTVFKITTAGELTTLHNFNGNDGGLPLAGLVQGSNGDFYGTTQQGGAIGGGTVFEITPTGELTTLHSFCSQPACADGDKPYAGLLQAANGNFYGTTHRGGAYDQGTAFEITPGGKLTTLHNFDYADGAYPDAGLFQATNGNLYGTTFRGGSGKAGTVFEITATGKLTTLHNFDYADGAYPAAGLLQATNASFYGTTFQGGAKVCFGEGCGTVFKLAAKLGPFVETLPASGNVGTNVIILGNNLTGTTSVTFNGTAATFTVVSDTEITTTVPNGASTGKVEVTTPTRSLTSNVNFRMS